MPDDRWSDSELDEARRRGDPRAAETIARVFDAGQVDALNRFMAELVTNREIPTDLPREVLAFLDATDDLPPWADPAQIREAERLFTAHGLLSIVSLVCASLPECYTMATGVKILGMTGQLGRHTNRRLHQTAIMVLGVMFPRGLTRHGTGIREAQKVRLIHAAIRHLIVTQRPAAVRQPDPATPTTVTEVIPHHLDWDIARDGWPINQEDLAFTLLTFGYVIPRALVTLGVPLTDDQRRAFLHAWNVVGHVMGVEEGLMAHTWSDATRLFDRIKARQAGPSPAGTRLTHSLLGVLDAEFLARADLRPLGPIMVRILVGDRTADMLHVHTRYTRLERLIRWVGRATVRAVNDVARRVGVKFPPLRWLATLAGRRIVLALFEHTGDTAPLQIPEEIRAGWQLGPAPGAQ